MLLFNLSLALWIFSLLASARLSPAGRQLHYLAAATPLLLLAAAGKKF
jgi:hypothetical protein